MYMDLIVCIGFGLRFGLGLPDGGERDNHEPERGGHVGELQLLALECLGVEKEGTEEKSKDQNVPVRCVSDLYNQTRSYTEFRR